MDESAYALLLGWYLGDGHIAKARRGVYVLSISNDPKYPVLNQEIAATMRLVKPTASPCLRNGHAIRIEARWKHWPCLFPQHGPGRMEAVAAVTPAKRGVERHVPDDPHDDHREYHGAGDGKILNALRWVERLENGTNLEPDEDEGQHVEHEDDGVPHGKGRHANPRRRALRCGSSGGEGKAHDSEHT